VQDSFCTSELKSDEILLNSNININRINIAKQSRCDKISISTRVTLTKNTAANNNHNSSRGSKNDDKKNDAETDPFSKVNQALRNQRDRGW
jgi:hypothetical protein